MKKLILIKTIAIVTLLAVITLSSCSATRRSGCPDTWGKVGYN